MNVKYLSLAAVVAVAMPVGTPVQAGEGQPRLLGCYQRALVPAEYDIKKTLVKKAERKYVKRNGRYELLEYPAVYQEHKTLIRGEYYVMQEIECD